MYSVTIEPINTVYFLGDRPDDGRWDVREDVDIDVPVNYADWPDGTEAPEQVLCVSVSDPNHYKVFRDRRDVDPAEFRETGKGFGGVLSRSAWKRFQREIDATLATRAVPADDPPGAMDEVIRGLRGGR